MKSLIDRRHFFLKTYIFKMKNAKAAFRLCRWFRSELVQLLDLKVALQGVRMKSRREPQRIIDWNIAFASNVVCCCRGRVCSELFTCACYVSCSVLVVAVKTLSQRLLR